MVLNPRVLERGGDPRPYLVDIKRFYRRCGAFAFRAAWLHDFAKVLLLAFAILQVDANAQVKVMLTSAIGSGKATAWHSQSNPNVIGGVTTFPCCSACCMARSLSRSVFRLRVKTLSP